MKKQIELHVWVGLTPSGEGLKRTKRLAFPCKRAFSSSLPWTLSAPLALLGIHPLAFGLDLHSQLSCLSSLLAHTADFGLINFHSYMQQFLIKKKTLSSLSPTFFSPYMACLVFSHFTLLCFADTVDLVYLTNWRQMCGTLVSSKSTGTYSSSGNYSLHVSVTSWSFLQYFQLFHYYISYDDLWWAIFDVTIAIALELQELCPYKIVNLIHKCSECFECTTHWLFPYLCLSSQVSLFLETQHSEIRPINNPTTDSKCWRKKVNLSDKLHCCLILRNCHNQPDLQQLPS